MTPNRLRYLDDVRTPDSAAEPLPSPIAIDCGVFVDPAERILTVRLPDSTGGYARMVWGEAWRALRRAEQAGWPDGSAPWPWASTPSHSQVVHGGATDGGLLRFRFPVGVAAYSELVGRPGLYAITVLDRNSHYVLAVKFLHRPAAA